MVSLEAQSSERSPDPSSNAKLQPQSTRSYLVGIGFLLIVVLLWTGSNFLTQDLFDEGFEKPFLVTYLNTSSFTFYLVPFLLNRWRGVSDVPINVDETRDQYESIPVTEPHQVEVGSSVDDAPDTLPPMTVRQTAQLASVFCIFWFVANWSLNASLDYTSVASSTILASMSGFFTLLVGRIFGVESFSLAKLGAVAASFTGVVLVSLADSRNAALPPTSPSATRSFAPEDHLHARPLLGDSLALLSAMFYALYVILLKVRIRDESRINMQLFFGFVGLFNVIFCPPIGLILHLTRAEVFQLPASRKQWAAIAVNMLITLSSDYLYVLAMLRTTPLIVTIGISLTIPVAMLGDFVFLGIGIKSQVLLGALLVTVSFAVIGLEDSVVKAWRKFGGGVLEICRNRASIDVRDWSEEEGRGRSRTRRRKSGSQPSESHI